MQIRFFPCIKTDCICFDILYVLKTISNFKNLLKIKNITYQLINNNFLRNIFLLMIPFLMLSQNNFFVNFSKIIKKR